MRLPRLRPSGIPRQGAVGAIATFLVLFVINFALKGGHFSAFDLKTLCMNVLPLALVALGQFFVVMTNGIDLSLGPVMSVAGSIAALTFSASVPGAIGAGARRGGARGRMQRPARRRGCACRRSSRLSRPCRSFRAWRW